MTLNQFFKSLNGKHIDVDGQGSATNKYQCVDLIKAYCNRVFGVPISAMNGYGNAHEYYDDFYKKPVLYKNFTRIAYKKGLKLQAGDVVVWSSKSNKSGAGHIAVATGKYNANEFESFDQNYPGGAVCQFVYHSYKYVLGVLRPKDQSKIQSSKAGLGSFPKPVQWINGRSKEPLYSQNNFKGKLLDISAGAKYNCFSKAGDAWLLVVTVNGGKHATAGFVKYSGGLKAAPGQSKTWKNGSTPETVYADVDCKTKVGSLGAYETAYCLAKIDGMYLVLYKLKDGTQKCGFVKYSGGC